MSRAQAQNPVLQTQENNWSKLQPTPFSKSTDSLLGSWRTKVSRMPSSTDQPLCSLLCCTRNRICHRTGKPRVRCTWCRGRFLRSNAKLSASQRQPRTSNDANRHKTHKPLTTLRRSNPTSLSTGNLARGTQMTTATHWRQQSNVWQWRETWEPTWEQHFGNCDMLWRLWSRWRPRRLLMLALAWLEHERTAIFRKTADTERDAAHRCRPRPTCTHTWRRSHRSKLRHNSRTFLQQIAGTVLVENSRPRFGQGPFTGRVGQTQQSLIWVLFWQGLQALFGLTLKNNS